MLGRKSGKIVSGVLQLHGMTFLGQKIDHDLVEQKVPFSHPAKAPALVQAKRARLELLELLCCLRGELARFHKLLQFGIHAKSNKLRRTPRFANKKSGLRRSFAQNAVPSGGSGKETAPDVERAVPFP